jgi:hypothetical protein
MFQVQAGFEPATLPERDLFRGMLAVYETGRLRFDHIAV